MELERVDPLESDVLDHSDAVEELRKETTTIQTAASKAEFGFWVNVLGILFVFLIVLRVIRPLKNVNQV